MMPQERIKGNTIKGDRDGFMFRLLEWRSGALAPKGNPEKKREAGKSMRSRNGTLIPKY